MFSKKTLSAAFLPLGFVAIFLASLVSFVYPGAVYAGTTGVQEGSSQAPTLRQNLDSIGYEAGYSISGVDEYSMTNYIGRVINVFLSLLGIIFVILIITAGYNWMTAAGDAAKVDKAKSTIWRAVIGLIIIVGAYAIWELITFKLFL